MLQCFKTLKKSGALKMYLLDTCWFMTGINHHWTVPRHHISLENLNVKEILLKLIKGKLSKKIIIIFTLIFEHVASLCNMYIVAALLYETICPSISILPVIFFRVPLKTKRHNSFLLNKSRVWWFYRGCTCTRYEGKMVKQTAMSCNGM